MDERDSLIQYKDEVEKNTVIKENMQSYINTLQEQLKDKSKIIYQLTDAKDEATKLKGKISELENITNVSNQPFEQIKEKFDLVLCQHLLEHVSYPLREMEKIFYSLKKGGYLYFEVPQGNRADNLFNLKRDIASYIFPWYRKYLSKLFFKKNDFYIMHEHINYFNKKSIKALCKESGLKIIKCFESEIIMRDKNNDLVFKTKIVYGMAKKI